MLRALDAAHVRRWAVACVQSLDAHREAIDRINVYPVADGDTGSNMLHTMRAALDALLRAPIPARTDAGAALAALARGALTGARGNSGVIVSQLLRGISDAVPRPDISVAAARTAAATGAASAQPASVDSASGGTSVGSASGGTASADIASGGASVGSASGGTASVDSASGGASVGSASGGTASVNSAFADSADSASGRASAGSASPGTASVDSASADFASGGTSAGTAHGGTASVDSASAQAAADIASADSAAAASAGAASPSSAAAPGADSADAASNGVAASGDGRMRELSGAQLRAALASGARRAAAALADPVPGTMISVLAAAASAAEAEQSDELGTVVSAAAAGAAAALDETPRQLAVLAAAGVVDAGGRGVVVLLDALVAVVSEQPAALAAAQRARTERVPARPEQSMYTARESGSDAFAYEVMYLLEVRGAGDPIGRLRDVLVGLGDCVSVVGDGDGLWTVHVHCNDVGAAIEVGVETGRPRQIRVARFADAPSAEASRFVQDRAVVVPARSSELADLLVREGVAVVRLDTDDTDETGIAYRLLEAITGTAAAHVTVLSSHASLIEVCDEASIRAVAAGQDVVVVPCASPVQVLAAVAVHDPRRRAGDDVVAMAEAAAATRRGEVVVSAEDAITWIGACASGDVLGLADGEVVLIEPGPPGVDALDRAACGVVERMLGAGGELITALLGADAPDELTDELTDYLRREHPETELVVYHGGQTDAVLIVGVE